MLRAIPRRYFGDRLYNLEMQIGEVGIRLTQVGAVASPGGAGALARAEAPASASGSGTRASRADQGVCPTKPLPGRLT